MAEALRLGVVMLTPVMPGISDKIRGLVGAEHSICIAVDPDHAELAKSAIESEFELEIHANRMDENSTRRSRVIDDGR